MKEPKINIETEYLLLHEILQILKRLGISIKTVEHKGGKLVREYTFVLSSAFVQFGVLARTLNSPMRYNMKKTEENGIIEFADSELAHIEDIVQTRYSLVEVATAVETLEGNKCIEKRAITIGDSEISNEIFLTSEGLNRLNKNIYLKEYLKERHDERTYNSVIWTNRMMIFFTFILAISAAIEVYKFFSSVGK